MRKSALFLLLLAACSIEKRAEPGTDPTTEVVLGQPAPDSVEVIISSPTYAEVGDPVPIRIVVRNDTDRTLDLHLTGRDIAFDITVMRADSSLVWRRLRNATLQQILQLKPIAPSESFTLGDHWRASERGEFLVTAELPTDHAPLRAEPVRIVVR